MDLSDMEREWRLWLRDVPEGAECPLHASLEITAAHKPASSNLPKLFVFLSKTCIPCGAFRLDWKVAPGFRKTVAQYFDVEIIEGGVDDPRAREFGVVKTPTFVPANGGGIRIEGYCGPAWLIDHLKPYTRSPLPPGAEPVASGDDSPPSPFKRSEPSEPANVPPVEPEISTSSGESGNSGRVLPGIVGTAAGTAAAGAWATWLVPLLLGGAVGGPLGAAAVSLGGLLIRRAVSKGATRAASRVEQRIEQRIGERWSTAPAPQPAPVPQGTAGSPRVNASPVIVETESRPLPQNVVHTSEFIPVEVNPHGRAYVWAKRKLVERYPDAASAVEVLESLIKQYRDALAKGNEPL